MAWRSISSIPGSWLAACWALALVAAFWLDKPVAQWLRETGIDLKVKSATLTSVVKAGGDWRVVLFAALLTLLLHGKRWLAAALVCTGGIAGVVNAVAKWLFGRSRPFPQLEDLIGKEIPAPDPFLFRPLNGGLEGIVGQQNLAFPSGHACVAFATAAALAILFPRHRGWFYGGAVLVALERVAENAHYLSDSVAAAGLAILIVHGIHGLYERLFEAGREANAIGDGAACQNG